MTDDIWRTRGLIHTPFCYTLCATEDSFAEVLNYLELPEEARPPFVTPGRDGTCHWFNHGETSVAVVCIRVREGVTSIQVAGLIVHEAVHLWQEARQDLNERAPSSEFEAYSVQWLAQSLLEQYASQVVNTKGQAMPAKKWIASATKNKGALHKNLGVPAGKTIPAGKLAAAAKQPGKVGKEARLAQTLKGFKK